jgi:hypothetical protein
MHVCIPVFKCSLCTHTMLMHSQGCEQCANAKKEYDASKQLPSLQGLGNMALETCSGSECKRYLIV